MSRWTLIIHSLQASPNIYYFGDKIKIITHCVIHMFPLISMGWFSDGPLCIHGCWIKFSIVDVVQ